MTKAGPKKNVAASVRDRLLRLARARSEDFNFVLVRYAMDRLLYRLSISPHGSGFILKGASLFTVWSGHPHRATKDLDLLGTGSPDLDRLKAIFCDVCDIAVEDDGATFDAASVTASRIKEDASYEKDFFDLRFLARSFEFDGEPLIAAIAATFARRKTAIPPSDPIAFTAAFTDDA